MGPILHLPTDRNIPRPRETTPGSWRYTDQAPLGLLVSDTPGEDAVPLYRRVYRSDKHNIIYPFLSFPFYDAPQQNFVLE
eukprot:scaffold19647_cov54-Attheya_sp.AAC.1